VVRLKVEFNSGKRRAMKIMKTGRSVDWTKEKIAGLTTPDVRQLRVNAERLNAPDIMERCDAVLSERRKAASAKSRSARLLRVEKDLKAGSAA
jgi:hypothetical protein